jgi:hypothetical protein
VSAGALQSVLAPLRLSQAKTTALVVEAIAEMAQAASLRIAASIAQATGCQLASALTRFYRLLHNPRLDDLILSKQMLAAAHPGPAPALIAIDWTEWHSSLRMLLGSVVAGRRAIPVCSQVFSKSQVPKSQNIWENNFLRLLGLILKDLGLSACILADRGFRRVSFLKLLLTHPNLTFVVRLCDQIIVEEDTHKRLLSRRGLQPGHAVDLGTVRLRQDAAVAVRVVGIWGRGQREPWWLATNLEDPLARIAALYDRRMAIEEQIRDTKGARFGLKLVWTQIHTPAALARFTLLIGLTILILTAIGHAVVRHTPGVQLSCKKKGPRLSLLSVGQLFLPRAGLRSLSLASLRANIPSPAFRSFPWLDALQTRPC